MKNFHHGCKYSTGEDLTLLGARDAIAIASLSEIYICKNRPGDRKCTQFLIKKSAAGQDNCRCHPLKIFDYCSAVETIGIKGKACVGAKGRCPLLLPRALARPRWSHLPQSQSQRGWSAFRHRPQRFSQFATNTVTGYTFGCK